MNEHRYILEPYKSLKSRYHCPACNSKEKTFARYIDTETGQYVSDIVGRCNRENNCGYHYTPKQYFTDNPTFERSQRSRTVNTLKHNTSMGLNVFCSRSRFREHFREHPEPSFIDKEIFQSSLTGYDRNIFTQFLTELFGAETTGEVISRYQIGTSKYWSGATVFYQIDISGNIRAGKIMLYDQSGHRVKEPFNYVTWVHKVLQIENYELRQCLFGEHLLPDNTLPVAIVESEKTACIASIYLPQFVWLACGQLQGLNADKCKVLSGKVVLLFPDLKGFDKWQIKAKELQSLLPDVRFAVSDYLERNASEAERVKGLDIADYLTKFDVKDFRRDVPKWLSDAVAITHKCKIGELSEDSYIDYLMNVCKYNDLTIDEYVSRVNEFEF